MPASTRRRYTENFKREAVRLVRESAHPVAQVARDLGIPDTVWYRWAVQHRQAEAHGTTRAAQRAEAEELTRVKRELARVTQERDFLKRAAAGFKDERRYVLRQAYDQLLAAAEMDLRRRVRRMAREIAPRLSMKSRTEIRWIWRSAVTALCEEFSQVWQGRIESLPVRMALVRPSEARRRDPDGSGGGHPPPSHTTRV